MKLSERTKKVIGVVIALGIVLAIAIIFFFVNTSYGKLDSVQPAPNPTITYGYADTLIIPDEKLKFTRTEIITEPAPKPKIVEPAPEFIFPPKQVPSQGVPVVPEPPAQSVSTEMDWVNAAMTKYGVYADPMTKFVFGPLPTGCGVAHACVITDRITYSNGVVEVVNITLYMKSDQLTEYLLFHEIAHTNGIFEECAADQYAAAVLRTGTGAGYYC